MLEARPRKHFGQNFLHDKNIQEKIIRAIQPRSTESFVEIGPGRGALTGRLLDDVARLDVIEIDRDLAATLPSRFAHPNLIVHTADALKFDFGTLTSIDKSLRLIGNLPYNISTPLLFHFLDHARIFSDLHIMLQKEVALRIVAPPGDGTYGRLSVAIAARCDVEILFHIKPGSFLPPPRVDSSFLRLVPDSAKSDRIENAEAFDRVVRESFGQRRKRLVNALKGVLTSAQIESANVDPGLRAEQIEVEQFIALGNICGREGIAKQRR